MTHKIVRKWCLLTTLPFLAATSHAQLWDRLTNPEMEVPVKHPPQVVLKEGQKIAVREFAGDGGAELSDRLVQALTEGGLEIIDRANLEAVLREQGLQAASALTPESAMKIGKSLGSSAVFVGRVNRSGVEVSPITYKTQSYGKNDTKTTHYAKVTARITASIQLVDLTTGKTYTGKMIEAVKVLENQSDSGVPPYPSKDEAITAAYLDAVEQMKRIVFPWIETVRLVVYDDNRANLKLSAQQIKVGDFEGAAQTLRASLATLSEKDAKYQGKLYYNLGIALLYSGHPQEALDQLQKAAAIKATSITAAAIKTAREAIALQEEQRRKEERPIDATASIAVETAPRADALTNEQVIAMAQAGLPDAVIISKIKASPQQLDASTDSLIAFKKAGVSDAVVLVIVEVAPNK